MSEPEENGESEPARLGVHNACNDILLTLKGMSVGCC